METLLHQYSPAGNAVSNDGDGNVSFQPHSGVELEDDEPVDPTLESSRQPPSKEEKPYVDSPPTWLSLGILKLSCLFIRKPAQFASLDTLLDKLLFIAVSGDGTL